MKNMFKKVNYCLIRSPKLSLDNFSNTFIKRNSITYDEIISTFSNDFMKKSIYLSSNSLYKSIHENNGDKEKILSSLSKYLTRMSTRCTPYGLFSSVNLVQDNEAEITNYTDNYSWYLSPDTDWIRGVIKRLESNYDILIHLKVKMNSSIYEDGNKLINIHGEMDKVSPDSQDSHKLYGKTSYTKTALLDYVFSNAQDFISFDMLYKGILEITASDVVPLVVFNYLKDLLSKNILISNLRPSLNGNPHLHDILSALEGIKSADIHYRKLLNIHKRFVYINQCSISDVDIDFIKDTMEKMKNYVLSKDYFNTILKQNDSTIRVSDDKFAEVNDLLNFLHIHCKDLPSKLEINEYKLKFLEKYGKDREVPLTRVIDPAYGIGFPTQKPLIQQNNSFLESLKQRIFDKVCFCLASNNDEIDIRDLFFTNSDTEYNHEFINDLSASLELAFITTSSNKTLNNQLYLSPIIGSNQSGKTPGRFIEALDDYQKQILKQNANSLEEIYINSNQIPVELNIDHPEGRILNINSNNSYFQHQTVLGLTPSNDEIKLDEMLIGIDSKDELYIRSNKYNKRLHFSIFNNINSNICPPIYQLLLNISEEISPVNILGHISTILSNMPITPRIVYKSIVLFPAKWKMDSQSIDFDNFKDSLLKWFKSFTNDTLFYLKQGDNRLLVNLLNDINLKEIKSYLKRNKIAIFNEVEKEVKDAFYMDEQISIYEIILPFTYNNHKCKELLTDSKFDKKNDEARTFLPFSEWTYLKFYLNIGQDEFISKHFTNIYNTVIEKELASQCFYIRYRDEKPHIRIRLKSNLNNNTDLYKYLSKYINTLYERRIIEKVVIDTYERETERYGGYSCIDSFETFFSKDSQLCSYLLANKGNHSLESLATLSIISMLTNFGLTKEQQIKLFNFVDHKQFTKAYRDKRKAILDLILNKDENLSPGLLSALNKRDIEAQSYSSLFNKMVLNEDSRRNIILSCVHMHCNRLFGTNREKEQEVTYFTLKTLKSLNYIN